VRLPHKHSVRPSVSFTPAEVRLILNHIEEPYRSIVIMAALTRVRASELFALTWADVDFERERILIRRTFYRGQVGPPKNPSSERAIPIGATLIAALRNCRSLGKANSLGLVFADASGNPYEPGNLASRVLQPVLKTLNLPSAGWRAFRKSVATALSELREPVRTAQQVLGHSSPNTTLAFYTHSAEESQRQALTLEDVMFLNVPKLEQAKRLIH
jgi:integrase